MKKTAKTLEDYFPVRGKCAFCGHKDARHRIFDSFKSRHRAGDSIRSLAKDFKVPVRIAKEIITLPDEP